MFKDALKAFLELKEHEAILSKKSGDKISNLAIGRVFYAMMDWIIVVGLGTTIIYMNSQGCSIVEIFMAAWGIDLLAALIFYFLSDMTGYDITLANSLRRSADVMFENGIFGKILGVLILLGSSIKAIVWEGPEVIYFLFRKELNTRVKFFTAMLVLSFGQGIFGAWLYTTGYEMSKEFLPAKVEFYQTVVMAIAVFAIFTVSIVILKKLVRWAMAVIRFFRKASKTD